MKLCTWSAGFMSATLLIALHTSAAAAETNTPVTVRTLGEWVTPSTFPDDLPVAHVRVRISTQTPIDIRASDFFGTFRADGGGTKTWAALGWPAPSYENLGLVTGPLPDVAPAEDLGALGRLHIEPTESIVGTFTFQLPLEFDSPAPIRAVVYRSPVS